MMAIIAASSTIYLEERNGYEQNIKKYCSILEVSNHNTCITYITGNGDLVLPQYTSDIIDVGIQNGGIGHSIPEKITKDEYDIAKMFMTDEEISIWESCYEQDGDMYILSEKNEGKLDEYDDTLVMALIINNQMSSVTAAQFREQMAAQMGVDVKALADVPVSDIGKRMGIELESFYKDVEDADGNMVPTECVDMRLVFKAMYDSGKLPKDTLVSMRDNFKSTFDTMGSSLVASMGRAYAKSMDSKAGKYEAPIAQGGTNVSGGQKQRLSIARNPRIFIFDDSFSALDLKTDAALRKALASKVTDSTVIIVAQRISTILHAEQILVMDEGRIVGKGTHEELMRNCEVYQQIARSQLSASELENSVAVNEKLNKSDEEASYNAEHDISDGKEEA